MKRGLLERELQLLQDEMLELGSMTEKAVQRALEALRHNNAELSQRVVEEDRLINEKRYQVEEHVIEFIATQSPLAADLRLAIATLFIVTDLERMADHAEGIGRIHLLLGSSPAPEVPQIWQMGERAIDMLRDALSSFVQRDVELARHVCNADDAIDSLYDAAYANIIALMIREPESVTRHTYMLWTAHNLERIGDRCTNIAERVIFLVTGRLEEINVSRY